MSNRESKTGDELWLVFKTDPPRKVRFVVRDNPSHHEYFYTCVVHDDVLGRDRRVIIDFLFDTEAEAEQRWVDVVKLIIGMHQDEVDAKMSELPTLSSDVQIAACKRRIREAEAYVKQWQGTLESRNPAS